MGSTNIRALLLFILMISGCGNMMGDILPSGSNKVPPEQPGTIGTAVGQNSPDFSLSDTLGNNFQLSSAVTTTDTQGVVLYFAMQWCTVCEGHLDNLRYSMIPGFPNVRFYVVDYTCGSVAVARAWQIQAGYAGSMFSVLADTNQSVLGLYQATMGTTIVIDSAGVVRFNEDYKDGSRLRSVLSALP